MPRLGLGLGLNLPRPIWFGGGGGAPQLPTAGNVGYYSADDINTLGFSSANAVNWWQDEGIAGSSNDLTQGTASANMTFIEHDTVTQFTLANQPTFDYDKIVTQDTSASQPTLVDVGGGELAVNFDSDYMDEIPKITGQFSYILEADNLDNSIKHIALNNKARNIAFLLYNYPYTSIQLAANDGTIYTFTTTENIIDKHKVSVTFDGVDLKLFVNGQLSNTFDATGKTFDCEVIGAIGSAFDFKGNIYGFSSFDSVVANVTNPTETPIFELLPDPTTMRKDDGTQPVAGDLIQGWHATDAELAVDVTGSSKYFNNFPFINDGDFVIEYLFDAVFDVQSTFPHRVGNDYIRLRETGVDINSPTGGQGFTQFFFGQTLPNGEYLIKIKRSGDDVSVYLGGVQVDVTKTIAGSWSIPQILGSTHTTNEGAFKRVRSWNSADDSGTPDFELLPTEESCNVLAGNQVSRWNSTTHKPWLNRILSDGNDDHLEGVAVQTGDFTYMFKLSFNALSTTEYIYSHTTGLSAVVLLSDNYIYLRDTTGANDIGLTGHTVELGEHVYTITREGNSLKYYVDSCLKDTVDVTGRTFELDTFGRPTDSLADLTAEWGVWNRALTKEELNYFSYIRSEDTNEILLPPLTPNCPI